MKEKTLINKITQKKFSSIINGYSPSEVDKFLDEICLEIEELNNIKNNSKTNTFDKEKKEKI
ncbi:MAG: DivIVA domain-containing protein [Metamycoplasmataceae bacterium]